MNNTPNHARQPRLAANALVVILGVLFAHRANGAITLPSGFSQAQIGGALSSPTSMAIAPDGRIFVCEQAGKLRVIKNGTLLSTPFLTLTVDSSGERGLLSVTFDPSFGGTNDYIYVYYTSKTPSTHNRVSRFTANGDVAVAGSEMVLLDLDNLSSATNHNAGALHFGEDGRLYVAVGENATSSNAQTLTNLLGKLLRINSDGSIPTDNPFYSTASGKNRAIWAMGLRNPFTFGIQPGTGRIFIDDVGNALWEEINDGQKGANYGWPTTEGATTDPRYETPVYTYPSNGAVDCAITGGTFYNPTTAQFPSDYFGDYFFVDYCGGWIHRLDAAGSYTASSTFASGFSSPVDLDVSPDGTLYCLTRGSGTNTGAVYEIQYKQNTAPTITESPASQIATVGKSVTFNVSASGTPPLSYQWQRNSANTPGATSSSYTIASAQLADNGATFKCKVTNSFGNATSASATLTVTAELPPTATINSPAVGSLYSGGNTISYSGTGTDPQDGALPASAYTWEIVFHHDTHTHPFIAPFSGVKSGTFVIPTTGETSDNVWYRIHLTVVDSAGLTTTTYVDVLPRKSTMSFATNPSGLQITLDGQPLATPAQVVGVVGIQRTLGMVSPQTSGGATYTFSSWSDSGAATHDISTPASNTSYVATLKGPTPTPTRTPTRTPTGAATGVPPTSTRTPTPAATRTPTPTSSAWTNADVGAVALAGSGTQVGGAFTVKGSGADIWYGSDQFHFMYQNLSGDGSIVARVMTVQNTNAWAKAGVMIRESLAANSRFADVLVTPSSGVAFQQRMDLGSLAMTTTVPGLTAPHWVKLARSGDTFTASQSLDGSSWTVIGTATIPMAQNIFIGLAVTGHDVNALCTATFDNLTVSGSSWTNADIGGVNLLGSGTQSGGVFTVKGSGADIWYGSDQFHFLYQNLSGDGSIVARVMTVQNTNAWAKAGVMIRESLAANSRFADVLVTPSSGVAFQRRAAAGATATTTTVSGVAAPYWVKLVRSGNTFTASRSSNGSSWTVIGTATITMAQKIYIGLAVTSHDVNALCTATLDNVSWTP